ncbi:MAG: hypothetical protein CSB06_00835 [Bacteroidia bacterium]|nr:MAG: hypothetical protein CSB06_00835 [Bacteroidia bacterium]
MANFTESHKWKVFMKYLYGWGASVVLIGALFKLTHWPGANVMLTVGLVTEAIIFFFSAFEPLHEELDWTLVYPQLAGLDDSNEFKTSSTAVSNGTASVDAIEKFNNMLDSAGDSNLFEKFGSGMDKLNTQVAQLSDLSDASLATNDYAENMKGASRAVSNLIESYNKSSEAVSYSADAVSDATQKVASGGEAFSDAYQKLTEAMDLDFSSLKSGNMEYNKHIGKLNKNLTALNAIFELQLSETDLDQMMSDLQGSVVHSKKYNEEITKLGQKLEALNTVYGNMLSAMNVKMS